MTNETQQALKNLQPPWCQPNGRRKPSKMPIGGKELVEEVFLHTPNAITLSRSQYVTLVLDFDVDNVDEHVMKLPQERYMVNDYVAEIDHQITFVNFKIDKLEAAYWNENYVGKGGPSVDKVKRTFKADEEHLELRKEVADLERLKKRALAVEQGLSSKQNLIPGVQGKRNALLKSGDY